MLLIVVPLKGRNGLIEDEELFGAILLLDQIKREKGVW